MCSQPPKNVDDRWILDEIRQSLPLIDPATRALTFTGGEALSDWQDFIDVLKQSRDQLPIPVAIDGARKRAPCASANPNISVTLSEEMRPPGNPPRGRFRFGEPRCRFRVSMRRLCDEQRSCVTQRSLRLRGLQLATDRLHHPITGHVIGARREGSLVCNPSTGSLVQSQQLPTDGLVADAPAADLPNPHDGMIILGESNRVDFNATGEAVVLKLKDMT
jgi:hypothetical protein